MKIFITAGARTNSIQEMLTRYNYELQSNPNISEALTQVTTTKQVDQLLLFDDAFIVDGKSLDITSVLEVMSNMTPVNQDMEIILITHVMDVYNKFSEIFVMNPLARCRYSETITSQVVVDTINGKDSDVLIEEHNEEQELQLDSIVEAEAPIVIETPPEPEPIPPSVPKQPKPVKVKEPKEPKKPKRKAEVPLRDLIKNNKIFIVTGIANTGVSSTACELANLTSDHGLFTSLVDLDTDTKRTTNYFSEIDQIATIDNKNGLAQAIGDPLSLKKRVVAIKPNLEMLGTTSQISRKYLGKVHQQPVITADVVNSLSLYSSITIVHVPLDRLFHYAELVRMADQVIFCCNATINSIQTIDNLMTTNKEEDAVRNSTLNVIYRKLCYVLTNYIPHTITADNWLTHLEETTLQEELHSPILGYIEHRDSYDNFQTSKGLYSNSREGSEVFEAIARRLLTL